MSYSYPANTALPGKVPQEMERTPSVNQCADAALESASRTYCFVASLHEELRQRAESTDSAIPCRSGIDGKLTDAAGYSDSTMAILQEIRQYLLG